MSDGSDSASSDAYLYDKSGRQVTPTIDVPVDYRNMSRSAARSIMITAAMKSNKRAQAEAIEMRDARTAWRRKANEDVVMDGT
jgi:hypothetical protein